MQYPLQFLTDNFRESNKYGRISMKLRRDSALAKGFYAFKPKYRGQKIQNLPSPFLRILSNQTEATNKTRRYQFKFGSQMTAIKNPDKNLGKNEAELAWDINQTASVLWVKCSCALIIRNQNTCVLNF